MIVQINFAEILPIWRQDLWPERTSEITATSAMCFLGGYDLKNMDGLSVFYAYKIDNNIAGVNSLHLCHDDGYRSRGLYVYPDYRGRGIGVSLLEAVINYAKDNKGKYVWSYPKQNSWKTYQKAGFELSSPWETSELGFNAYCVKYL